MADCPQVIEGEVRCYGNSQRAVVLLNCDGSTTWIDSLTGAEVDPGLLVPCGQTPPPTAVVPDVGGDTEAAAQAAITAAGLTPVHNPGDACDNVVPAGSVLTQTPAPGTVVALGSNVGYTLSTGPCPEPVIDLRPTAPVANPDTLAAFEAAAQRLSDMFLTRPTPENHDGNPQYDRILVNLTIEPIDGPGNILGSAGPELLRPDLTTLEGSATFDSADTDALTTAGEMEAVALHELTHILGLGPLWSIHGLTVDPNTTNWGYTGPEGLAAYNALAGRPPGDLDRVPVEPQGGAGTAGSHWNEGADHDSGENCMAHELMSGSLSGSASFSAVSIASLRDLGYDVDVAQADPWACGAA